MIRVATEADIPRLLEMGRCLYAESPTWGRLTFSEDRMRAFCTMLMSSDQGFLWVGEKAGRVVGAMFGIIDEHWSSNDLVASELVLYIEPESRGGSLAMRLITNFTAWADVMGAKFAEVGVSTGICDDLATRLYERCGYQRTSVGLEVEFVHRH